MTRVFSVFKVLIGRGLLTLRKRAFPNIHTWNKHINALKGGVWAIERDLSLLRVLLAIALSPLFDPLLGQPVSSASMLRHILGEQLERSQDVG